METKVCIVGAGPYGIAVAHELWLRGVEFAIVGEPFDLWFRHTLEGMVLRSNWQASEIYARDDRYHIARYRENLHEGEDGIGRIGIATFRSYLREVGERLPFPVVRASVTGLEERGGDSARRFRVRCSDGSEIASRAVVVATGLGAHRYVPEALRVLPADRVVHSWHARRIDGLRGERVLVVGAGQSAAEAVESLRAGNRVAWVLRHPPLFFQEPLRVPSPLFKTLLVASYGLYRLPFLVRTAGRLFVRPTITPLYRATYADPAVEKIRADVAHLGLRQAPDGRLLTASGESYDRVVSATGFRFSLGGLPFLSPALVERLGGAEHAPRLDARFETAVPDLFMVGGIAEPTFGPAMRFIFGSHHTARLLGRTLARR